jgi:hypothetical protein
MQRCNETFREPVRPKKKQGSKRAARKCKKPTTKITETQEAPRRSLRPRTQEVRYTLRDTEGELDGMDLPDEIQGYMCVSADPGMSGTAEGGENFIITTKELRMLLQDQCQAEDQGVWLTTAQAGFPTVHAEGELENILD